MAKSKRNAHTTSIVGGELADPRDGIAREKYNPKKQQHCVFLGNIHLGMTPGDIERMFRRFGPIQTIEIKPAKRWWSHTFGFIAFKTKQAADNCLCAPQNFTYHGQKLTVGRKQKKIKKAQRICESLGFSFGSTSARESSDVPQRLSSHADSDPVGLRPEYLAGR